jgi:hypothetical protein
MPTGYPQIRSFQTKFTFFLDLGTKHINFYLKKEQKNNFEQLDQQENLDKNLFFF